MEENKMDRWELEELILGMADIVYENRELRRKLEEMKEYKRKYNELIDQNVKQAGESQKALFDAIMSGAFVRL